MSGLSEPAAILAARDIHKIYGSTRALRGVDFDIKRGKATSLFGESGMLLVILNGGIDLSVGSTLGLSGILAGFLMQGVRLEPLGVILYPPVWTVAVLCCGLGALVGLVNGVLVARFRAPPFVATLGVLYMLRGVALLITSGLTYNNLSGRASLATPASAGWASTGSAASPSASG